MATSAESPIDQYYDAAEALTLVGDPGLLTEHSVLGRLLLLGHTSVAENYTRAILAGLLNMCSIAREYAGPHVIPFASVAYYSRDEMAFGLFEGKSLASGPELTTIVRKLTGIEIKQNSVAADAIQKFDKVCHLRHAAVHAHGGIGTGNAKALGLSPAGSRMRVDIDLSRLHEVAMICRAFVQELNQHLFDETFNRWVSAGILVRDYQKDRRKFTALLKLFLSKHDDPDRLLTPKAVYTAMT